MALQRFVDAPGATFPIHLERRFVFHHVDGLGRLLAADIMGARHAYLPAPGARRISVPIMELRVTN